MAKQQEKSKKPTNAQLQKRIERAVIHVDRTKDTKEVFFSDKGLRLVANEDVVIVGTGYHDHVFQNITGDGVSRPYLYVKRLVEIALENDCVVEEPDGTKYYSYQKLMAVLEKKGDNDNDYLIAYFIDQWLLNIFNPLYTIGETKAYAFLVFFDYMHNIAKNAIFLDEHKDGLTNKAFVEEYLGKIKEFAEGMKENVIFEPKTDEDVMRENIEAIQANDADEFIKEQAKNENEEQKNGN